MARVSKEFKKYFNDINFNELSNPHIIVVDMINGFCKKGQLADPIIMDIVPNIKTLLESINDHQKTIYFADEHTQVSPELDFFPTHCMGDEESQVVDQLKGYGNVIGKNSTNGFHTDKFRSWLNDIAMDDVLLPQFIITGCCTDICVMTFALTLKTYFNQINRNVRVIIPIDCVDTYHIEGVHDAVEYNEFTLNLMKQAGIEVVRCIRT